MIIQEKIPVFQSSIENMLLPEIDSNYVLCGLPNYSNIGDMLIYQGTIDLLRKVKYKCLDRCFYNDYYFSDVDDKTIFIIMGGGYMGDTWRAAWNSVVKLIERFPCNKFIIFPQSIYYSDKHLAKNDVEVFSKNNRIIICARDNDSYIFAKNIFNNKVILVPDMAFNMNFSWYGIRKKQSNNILYLRRKDKEFVSYSINTTGMDERDWPTMDYNLKPYIQKSCEKVFYYYHKIVKRYPKMRVIIKPLVYGIFFSKIYKPLIIGEGVRFINQYQKIYTTRLHGMILSAMMGKETVFLDNSYGKVSSYYKTWLNDIDNIHPIDG